MRKVSEILPAAVLTTVILIITMNGTALADVQKPSDDSCYGFENGKFNDFECEV